MNIKANRLEVYDAINSEREYQDLKWNDRTTSSGGNHSLCEWLVYIEDYINEAKHIASREPDPVANEKVVHIMRKIAAMAVCAMEQHGAPLRKLRSSESTVEGTLDALGTILNEAPDVCCNTTKKCQTTPQVEMI